MTKKRKNLPYENGTWFAVPLRRGGGYAVGVVARTGSRGVVFGYFFGPRRMQIPTLDELTIYRSTAAIWHGFFGDLGLINNEWSIIGTMPTWSKQEWPLPRFARIDDTSRKAWASTYNDELELIAEEPVDVNVAEKLTEDALSGYGAVEKWLTRLIETLEK